MVTSKRKRTQVESSGGTKRRPQRQASTRRHAPSDDSDFQSESSTHSDQQTDASDSDQNTKKEHSDRDVVLTAEDFKPPTIIVPEPKNSPFADAISPSSMVFMATLMENNDRSFMKLHEDQWKATRKDFMDFVDLLAKELYALDNTILVQPAKDAIYRQHRDLRFTLDRIPYKCTLKASFTTQGKKSPLPGYHISLKPGNNTKIAVGIFQPNPVLKQRMRAGIIRQGDLLREALSTDTIKEVFGSTGLALLNDEDRLKVAPKGIDKTHPEIELLRYNSLFVTKTLDDVDVVSEGFLDKVLDVFEALLPFVTVLNAWIA
ncbi:hypothetical protein BC941DRAFT_410279 [Chlamydoabsidia padenii]|nr:hypothetical protein BC941DRAFT_410279 [Chlamydoabsidia padenii]